MIIGTFAEYKGTYIGTIDTLAFSAEVTFQGVASKKSEQSPDYRVYAKGIEIGAGWSKISKNNNPYIDVALDDPSFAKAINCRLVQNDDGRYQLHWNR